MKIVFMGTPEFALASLDAVADSAHELCAVFTRPDKPKNRGQKVGMSPVKMSAIEKEIPVYQPVSLKTGEGFRETTELLNEIKPDCIVVVAYGQILPREVLEIPRYGCINIHASLLPRYRGASPIHSCIINGETQSGVTIMKMAEGLDTGDMILSSRVEVPFDMKFATLHDILMKLGADLLLKTLESLENNTAVYTPQDETQATYAPMLSKKDTQIDWTHPAVKIYNKIRGLSESHTAYTFLNGKRLKIFFSELGQASPGKPGEIADFAQTNGFNVICGDSNTLKLTDIQLEGASRMNAADFLRGRKIKAGTIM
ncbi:MAG: methionyl-tRNA formyltransferase [Oscillospiraceae bacterium]|nr:methionyl-tRNA formyltransferase [Oscillospiraceae bacterium]